ncbi:hypothetical protein [Lentilactobacillus farraginis]|uniref:Uncharacterized protein n=1 Tax=Lentilactobacillus farraginis DSM 18382 = JCM 14108 TaxID=1423743 RepID=X0PB70_9LACO|nr:hypothetical protein [Lentilactobacillus farraginis]KRM08790.1 hypothetical protein FD41_GL002832 [Lentilactobacillus farraginis DSM 18382 = JCM 14108]GAF36948.1 hypothetical protein JCM14108_1945 [Lentilactobacillus farraginis DSM 18382 = JCM 14108]
MLNSKKKNFSEGFNSLGSIKNIQELFGSELSYIQGGVPRMHRRMEDWVHQFMKGFNRTFK